MDNRRKELFKTLASLASQMQNAAEYIGKNPELGYEEFKASTLHKEMLAAENFKIQTFDDMPTAYLASFSHGIGSPVISLMAEYDALPKLGHACGHNISGIASLGSAIAIAHALKNNNINGTIQVIGCPAEEGNSPNGGGKVLLLERHAFDTTDIALSTHAGPVDILTPHFLARSILEMNFFGKNSHAAACPEEGINALDAAVLTINAINALRQQTSEDVRIHGIVSHGGDAVNVIPSHAQLRFGVRAHNLDNLEKVQEKVLNCARGAALATGCTFEYSHPARTYANLIQNKPLLDIFSQNMFNLGISLPTLASPTGSTDVGNVSLFIPTIHPIIGINNRQCMLHTSEFEEACCSQAGYDSMMLAARLMALTVWDIYENTDLLPVIKAWHNSHAALTLE